MDVVERVITLLESLGDEELVLAVDTTGVGRPVADMLKRQSGGVARGRSEHPAKHSLDYDYRR